MNILFSTGVFPPNLGGPGKIVEGLSEELKNKGYNPSVITLGDDDNKDRQYKIVRVPFSVIQPFRFLVLFARTLGLALKNDIIYATDNYSNGFSAAIVSKILNKPLILRFTGDSVWESEFNKGNTNSYITDFQNEKHDILTRIKIWRRNFILKTAKKIITDCEFLKNLVSSFGINSEKITVINNAVDQNFEIDSKNGNNNILTMARLVPWKGIDTLIKIMPEVIKQIPEAKLVIAGDGPQMNELKKLVDDLNLTDSIQLLGKIIDKNEKQKLYNSSSIFVLNTFYEGMSNVITEAMAQGLPIVATRSGGNQEFTGDDNGILVDYNNTQQITQAVIELLTNQNKSKELGEKSKEKSSKYSWDLLVEKNIKLINSIVSK
jgi:glycosyltransferase involved in cell wall biosynthesis